MKKIILIAVLILAFALRFYRLDSLPALNADEAALGYNAYSLLETGKDEHGNPWPIHFQSFNDYKPGLYVYMIMPFVKILGLNVWSVRIPAAFLSVVTVGILYLLVKQIYKRGLFALFATFLLAVSPWHIHFSRGGWEVNVATFFITLGVYLFLVARKRPWIYTFSLLSFVASLYAYHSARLIAPLLGLFLLIFYFKKVKKNLKGFGIAVVISIIFCIPLLLNLAGPAGISRAAGVGLLADAGPRSRADEQRGEHSEYLSPFAKSMHNKVINYSLAFLENWGDHYQGEFLFLSGDDIQRNKVPETGQMHMFEMITVAVGLFMIMRKAKRLRLIVLWLLIAPLAASLTFQSPHALRAQNMVIPLTIISGFGLYHIMTWIKNLKVLYLRQLMVVVVSVIVTLSVTRYVHMYHIHMVKEYPFSSQYGVEELVNYTQSKYDELDNIVVTDRYDQPYILFLFYSKFDPKKFQADHQLTPRDQYGFSTVRKFDKYVFSSINNWDEMRKEYPNALIAGTDEEIFTGTNIVQRIYGPNGYLYFEIIKN